MGCSPGCWPAGRQDHRTGLSLEAAVDIAWTLSSDEVFTLFVREREWTVEDFEAWLREALRREILAA